MDTLITTLAFIGGITTAYVVYAIYDFISFHFIKPSRPLQSYLHSGSPSYALITGASAGIGLGIAQELVKHGFGVVLLGHLEEELGEAKKGIERDTPGADVRIVVMDARTATSEEMTQLVTSLEKLNMTILINNVGGNAISLPPLRELATHSPSDVDVVIDMNARFMSRLTTLMLPLLTRPPKHPNNRSLILNFSSAGWVGLPWLTLYGATKAFNLSFSHGLARELASSPATSHVDCLAVIPGEVISQGNRKGVPESAPTWDVYGRYVVSSVDGAVRRGNRDVIPYWQHDLETRILPWLDEGTRTKEIAKVAGWKKKEWDAYYAKDR